MALHLIDADAPAKIEANRDRLKAGSWGGAETVCMMSALVSGASNTDACVTAGWPKWLAELNVSLFDAEVGAADEALARNQFAYDVAVAVSVPRDYDRARDLFLIRRLDTGEYSALKTLRGLQGDWPLQIKAVEDVVALLRRRADGEDVVLEMKAAARAADAAARAARAVDAAVDAAVRAAAYAAYAAAFAAFAAFAAAYAADAAAYAAARADLIAALNEA